MDEKTNQQLGEARGPLPMRPGDDQKINSEYVRNGTCSIFAFIEPLGGKHHASVREYRTATDWAEEIKYLSDVMYPDAEKIVLVMDNLNTHKAASLYKKYPAAEEKNSIAAKVNWQFRTPDARIKLQSLYPTFPDAAE